MFSRAFVINLPFRGDRFASFKASLPASLGDVTRWDAVHGDSIAHPDWWRSGAGAWGCYRSHLQILEHCYQRGIESYIVFEDDAIFRPDFEERFTAFMAELPADWEQIYLGGQLLHVKNHPPAKVNENVFVPYNVNRTQCFAVHKRGYEKLYKHLNAMPFAHGEHIDHHLGRLHETGRLKVYCPSKWLVGQDGGSSNISGNTNGATFFDNPDALSNGRTFAAAVIPAVFLEAPLSVAIELERRGWHRGHWQNADRLDRGVCNALGSIDVKSGLNGWYRAVRPEAVRQGSACVCLYHPNLDWACVESLDCAKFERVTASTVAEAEAQLRGVVGSINVPESNLLRRNLIYHIWPNQGNGTWQWNVNELLKRIHQFDGVRTVGIATSENADTVEDVKRAFSGHRIDNWIVCQNDRKLGEVVTFPHLLKTLPKDDSITFYGHAKGVKYSDPSQNRPWTQMMYDIALDDPEHVDSSLEQFACTGPFLREQPEWMPDKRAAWHYSGTFFWFKNAEVFAVPNWSDVGSWYHGVEMWIGHVLDRSKAGCLFGHDPGHLHEHAVYVAMQQRLEDWKRLRRSEAQCNPQPR